MELPTEWSLLNDKPMSLFGLSSVIIGDTAFLIGGSDSNSSKPQTILRISVLDIRSGHWKNVVVNANDALNRTYHASTVLHGKIYSFGGSSVSTEFGTVLDEYIVMTTTSEGINCSLRHNPSAGRKGWTANTIGLPDNVEKIVLFGGTASDGSSDPHIVIYKEDVTDEDSHFQKVTIDGAVPPARIYHSASVTGRNKDLLVVHGGRSTDSQQLLSDVWVLDASTLLLSTDIAPPPPETSIKGKSKGSAKGTAASSPGPVWSAVSISSPLARCLHGSVARSSDKGFILWVFGGVGESGLLTMDTVEVEVSGGGGGPFTEESSGVVGRGADGQASTSRRFGFASSMVTEYGEPVVVCVFGGVPTGGEDDGQSELLVLDPSSEVATDLLGSLPSCLSATLTPTPPESRVTIEYRNGEVYYGEVLRDDAEEPASGGDGELIRHGEGKMSYGDGSSYEVMIGSPLPPDIACLVIVYV